MERMRSQLEDKTYKEQELNEQLVNFAKNTENYDENLRKKIEILEKDNQQLTQSISEKNENLHNIRMKVVS